MKIILHVNYICIYIKMSLLQNNMTNLKAVLVLLNGKLPALNTDEQIRTK